MSLFIIIIFFAICSIIFIKSFFHLQRINKCFSKFCNNVIEGLKHQNTKKLTSEEKNIILDIKNNTIIENSEKFSIINFQEKISFKNYLYKYYNDFERVKIHADNLVGLGILGTFCGLVLGVSVLQGGLNVNSELLLEKLDGLLSGMHTAFLTSIIGMTLSIILKYLHSKTENKIDFTISDFHRYLNELYPYKNFTIYNNFISYYEKETDTQKKIKLIDILKENLESNEKTSRATTSMNNDLANSISNSITSNISPALENLNSHIENFVSSNKNGTQDTIAKVIEKLEESMRNMVTEFKEVISEDTKNELSTMAQMLSESGEYFIKIPEVLNDILRQIEEQQNKQVSHYSEINSNLNLSIESIKNEIKTYHNVLDNFGEVVSNFSEYLTNDKNNHDQIANMINKFSSSLVEQGHVMQKTVQNTGQFMNNVQDIGGSLDSVFGTVNKNINQYERVVGSSLNKYLDSYSLAVENFTDKIENALLQMQNCISNIQTITEEGKNK